MGISKELEAKLKGKEAWVNTYDESAVFISTILN